MTSETEDVLFGYIDSVVYHNAENGYTVAQLIEAKKSKKCCIVGHLSSINPGETVRCFGSWKRHLAYGWQFDVKEVRSELPADVEGIRRYLGSGLIKGIGKTYAGRIVERFGQETLRVIDEKPEDLKEIEGIGPKRLEKITTCWRDQKSIREVMIFLQAHGVTPAFAQKIFKRYGNNSIKTITENPYQLARDINGIGFKMADALAEKMGITKDSPRRIEAGIEYVLNEASGNGHVCYPLDTFLQEAQAMLETKEITPHIEALEKEERIMSREIDGRTFIWLRRLFLAEMRIAGEIRRLQSTPSILRAIDVPKALIWVQEALKIELASNQKTAVSKALSDKMHIITGGPGTGKSTITNAILAVTARLTSKIILTAPTGRAAKRMSEITKHRASTIHSLLEFDFKNGGFKKGRENPLDCDLIIIDESSMIDTLLMNSLLKAIPDHARVIFVGDINQLPSVGPGNVLREMIQSHVISVSCLTEIFRQAAGSRIITNAHRINQGILPEIDHRVNSDFFFIGEEEPEAVLKTIISLVTKRLPERYKLNAVEEIQVLAPMRRGVVGIENLNNVLQEAINPHGPLLVRMGRGFRVNDKVMQIQNNYEKEVFNGDVGKVTAIDMENQLLIVTFDGRPVEYDFSDMDELVLAYAVSIHKYQGSECPCVIMPIHTTHFKMLQRNLLYTGVTRGKRLVILVGTLKALGIAVTNNEVLERHTGLLHALQGKLR